MMDDMHEMISKLVVCRVVRSIKILQGQNPL